MLTQKFIDRSELLLKLGAIALFMATIEFMIPKPMPFLKLGLANFSILLFINFLSFREILLLTLIKVFGQGILTGTLLSYIGLFSLCASFSSSIFMWLSARLLKERVSYIGISVIGAIASTTVQLILALSFFFPGTGWLLIPWSLTFGLASGFLLGIFVLRFSLVSQWLKQFYED